MTEKDFIENYIKEEKKKEERLGRYMEPWETDDSNPEDTNGTLGILRQLYMYKKMYTRLHNTIIKVTEDCSDSAIKETLVKSLIDAELLCVTNGTLPPEYMSSEELIIAYLLAYIHRKTVKVPTDYIETVLYKESLDWLKDLSAKEKMCKVVFNYADAIEDYNFSELNCTDIIFSRDDENDEENSEQ